MNARLKKWFSNPDGKTRYKVVLDADNFIDCPVKEVHFSNGIQVVKDDNSPLAEKWSLTVFGEERVNWFVEFQIPIDALPWEKNTIAIANGIKRADTPYMKKAEIVAILNKIMVREVESMSHNALAKPEFRNLKLK